MFQNYMKQLLSVILFEGLNEKEILKVLCCLNAYSRCYSEQEFIYFQGEEFFEIIVILEGEVEVTKQYPDGKVVMISKLKESDTFGEDIICSGRFQGNYSLIANKKSVVLYIDGKKLLSNESVFCNYRCQVNLNMLKRIAQYSIYG